jgi:hypothetical protein
MTSGVYPRNTMSREYRGFPRVRQRRTNEGSYAVVAGSCEDCKCPVERDAKSLRRAQREGRGFVCPSCNASRTHAKRGAR